MDGDGSVLSKLLLGFMHLADEVDESLPGLGNALLRPIRELELSDRPGLAVLRTRRRGIGFNRENRNHATSVRRAGCTQRGRCQSELIDSASAVTRVFLAAAKRIILPCDRCAGLMDGRRRGVKTRIENKKKRPQGDALMLKMLAWTRRCNLVLLLLV